jgi:release factor glutamine methyltransferase
MDVRTALKEAMGRLREGRVPSHTLAAELLLMHVLSRERAWLYAHPEQQLDSSSIERYLDLIARRIAGTPAQYLTRRQEFWGLEFEVEPGVFIPRPETEHVVEVALERLGQPSGKQELAGAGLRIADVGTGPGCLAIALARELPGAEVLAADISSAALAVARRNAARHGVCDRIHFGLCNVRGGISLPARRRPALRYEGGPLCFHLIVSNPPYVGQNEAELLPREVREHEPQEALFAGEHGDEFYEPLIRQAEQLLSKAGILVVELGYHLLGRVRGLLDPGRGWLNVTVTNDLAGIPRVLAAERA